MMTIKPPRIDRAEPGGHCNGHGEVHSGGEGGETWPSRWGRTGRVLIGGNRAGKHGRLGGVLAALCLFGGGLLAAQDEVGDAVTSPVAPPVSKREEAEVHREILDQGALLGERLGALERQLRDRDGIWVAFTWGLVLALFALGAMLVIGHKLLRREVNPLFDELARQRLRLEGIEQGFRDFPGQWPRPNLDVALLAEHLQGHFMPGPAASEGSGEKAPAEVSSPASFYRDDDWLPRVVAGPRAFFRHLETVRSSVAEIFEELAAMGDPGEALALVSWMWSRFASRRLPQPEGRWRQLLSVAEETGVWADPELSERMAVARSTEEAKRMLLRSLYREVLEQGISDHLILLEELRHLPSFCGAAPSRELCESIAGRVDPMTQTLLEETERLTGYHPHYVPLFSDLTDDSARFLRNNPAEKLPGVYRQLEVPRRQVLFVLAYGMRRDRGWENEETQVILS